jgi:hypothetical protein
MTPVQKAIAIACALIGCGWTGTLPAASPEVYRWVDENGVVNFSQTAPTDVPGKVSTVELDAEAPDYDPEQDIYNVAAQAERMQALREEMEQEREARREQRRNAPAPPVTEVQQGVNYGYPYGYPTYPRPPARPPARPRPPVPEPYDTSTLVPPGQRQDPNGR